MLFRSVWAGGKAADDVQRLATLTRALGGEGVESPGHAAAIKQRLIQNGAEAIEQGVFGVPTLLVDDRLLWGLDALPMLRAYLDGDAWFDAEWHSSAALATGVQRRR